MSRKSLFLRLGRYVFEQWPLFILAILLTLGSNQLALLGPRYSGAAIDAIALSGLSLHADGRIAVISLPFAARKGLADEHFETAIDIARSLAIWSVR